jgi:hypothetical protein
VPGTDSEDTVEKSFSLVFIDQEADQSLPFELLLNSELLLPAVVPPCHAAGFLQGEEEDVDVVVSPEEVLMRVDKLFGERVADVIQLLLTEPVRAEDVVDAVEAAEQREPGLLLEELSILFTHARKLLSITKTKDSKQSFPIPQAKSTQ